MHLLGKKGIGLKSVIVMMRVGRKKLLLVYIGLALALAEISLVAASYYEELGEAASARYSVVPLHLPIVHMPTYLGSYPFILGSGNLLENGSAYSYVWINASALKVGDSFVVLPALNIGLVVPSEIHENNFTLRVVYTGSPYDSHASLFSSFLYGNKS